MKERKYFDYETETEITVYETTRKETLDLVKDYLNTFEICDNTDMTIYIEYKDGSAYLNNDGDETGTFKKTNIKGIRLDDGYDYYVYGAYEMNDLTIPELI